MFSYQFITTTQCANNCRSIDIAQVTGSKSVGQTFFLGRFNSLPTGLWPMLNNGRFVFLYRVSLSR